MAEAEGAAFAGVVTADGFFAAGGATSIVSEHPNAMQARNSKQIENCRIINSVVWLSLNRVIERAPDINSYRRIGERQ